MTNIVLAAQLEWSCLPAGPFFLITGCSERYNIFLPLNCDGLLTAFHLAVIFDVLARAAGVFAFLRYVPPFLLLIHSPENRG